MMLKRIALGALLVAARETVAAHERDDLPRMFDGLAKHKDVVRWGERRWGRGWMHGVEPIKRDGAA